MRHTELNGVLTEPEIHTNTVCLDKLEETQEKIASINLRVMEGYARLTDIRHTTKGLSERADIEAQSKKLAGVMINAQTSVRELQALLSDVEREAWRLNAAYQPQ